MTTGGGLPLDRGRLAAARLWAAHHHPYLAAALFAAPLEAAPGLGRATIDRWWRVHLDPDVVNAAAIDALGGELLHLCAHVLRGHAERADRMGLGRPADVHHWGDATDAEISDDFPIAHPRISPSATPDALGCPAARLAEEYYRSGRLRAGLITDCGSGAHGQVRHYEHDADDRQHRGIPPDQQDLIRRQVADDIAKAGAEVPAGLRVWAARHRGSTVDWRRELAAELRRSLGAASGAIDYSYRRPSRRAGSVIDVVLPSLRQPTVEVAVICDTSASVSGQQLGEAVGVVDALLRGAGVRSVRLLACDEAVHTATRVARSADVVLIGGGGTDLTVGIEQALHHRPRPQVVVVLTDGFTPWPVAPPPATVVVGLLVPPEGSTTPPPPPWWARSVVVGRAPE